MKLFTRDEPSRVGLIDVRAEEVVFGYRYKDASGMVYVCYQSSLPIDAHVEEAGNETLVRVFAAACDMLVTEGAPALKNATGKGNAESFVIQLAAPWQRTILDQSVKEFDKTTTITQAVVTRVVEEGRSREKEEELIQEVVLSTTLNGYAVKEPIGKQAKSVHCRVMRSYVPSALTSAITDTLRAHFHSTSFTFVAFEATAYRIVKEIAAFHSDFSIIAMGTSVTTVIVSQSNTVLTAASIMQGTDSLLYDVYQQEIAANDDTGSLTNADRNARFAMRTEIASSTWEKSLFEKLLQAMRPYALLPTVILIAPTDTRDFIARTLKEAPLRGLWSPSATVTITPLLMRTFSKRITFKDVTPDLGITLLALC